jgi:MFS family permease
MSGLDQRQRRIVLSVCIVAAFLLTLSAAFNYLLSPIVQTFDPSETQTTLLRQVPAIAALLVVFPAGALGGWIGPRRFIMGCALLYTFGSILVAVAPVIQVVTLGFLFVNIGRAAMFIVGLGYMAAAVGSREGRASAFATFSMILPFAYLVMPVLAGLLIGGVGWRAVAWVTAGLGLIGFVLAFRLIPRDGERSKAGEMWTPTLAGIALVFVVQALNSMSAYGFFSIEALGSLAAAAICVLIVYALMRHLRDPTLSVDVLRHGGFLILLSIILLFSFANLWFYTTLALEYIYGLTSLQTALAMMPAQLASIAGAAVAGMLIKSRGISMAGTGLIVGVAVCLFATVLVGVTTPLWLPIAIVTVYAGLAIGAGVPLTNAIMNMAPRDGEGGASAWRGAASNVGSAVSVAFMTAIVATAIGMSLDRQMEGTTAGESMNAAQMTTALRAINSGESAQDIATQYAVPSSDIEELAEDQAQALIVGYRAHGVVGGAVTLVVSAIFWAATRRMRRSEALEQPPV